MAVDNLADSGWVDAQFRGDEMLRHAQTNDHRLRLTGDFDSHRVGAVWRAATTTKRDNFRVIKKHGNPTESAGLRALQAPLNSVASDLSGEDATLSFLACSARSHSG